MKEGWEYKTLGEVAKVFAGGDVPKNRMSKCKKEPFIIPIYTNGIENEGLYGYTDIARVNDLSLTISARGTIGAIFKRNNPFFPAIRLITVCPQNIVDINFLYYVLLNSTFTKSGTTIPQLTVPMLKQYRFAIPENISIQQNIANYLDSSFKLIDEIKNKALKSLTEAKALFQSALAEAMEPKEGWEYKKIYEVGQVVGGTTPNTNNPNYWNGDLCWISPAELTGNHYLYDSRKKITQEAVNSKSLKLLPVGTVILSSRAPIGKVTINKVPTYCNQGFKCVICKNSLYNEYLYWWFYGHTKFLNSLGTGATFAEISKKVVENIIIPIPSIDEQSQIVSHLDKLSSKVRDIEEKYQKMVEECDALKQAMLRDVFE